jgi:hypothetical protein
MYWLPRAILPAAFRATALGLPAASLELTSGVQVNRRKTATATETINPEAETLGELKVIIKSPRRICLQAASR